MTMVQVRYRLARPLNDALMNAIARAHAIYGIHRVRLVPELDALVVEYDASRLTPQQVEAELAAAGIALWSEA